MFVSGCVATLAGLWVARMLPAKFESMLSRLGDRGSLIKHAKELARADLEQLIEELRFEARRWSLGTSLFLAIGTATAWAAVIIVRSDGSQPFVDKIGGPLVGAIGGLLVGIPLGRMISYGLLDDPCEDRRSHCMRPRVIPTVPQG